MVILWRIYGFELAARISFNSVENACDSFATCQNTVLTKIQDLTKRDSFPLKLFDINRKLGRKRCRAALRSVWNPLTF